MGREEQGGFSFEVASPRGVLWSPAPPGLGRSPVQWLPAPPPPSRAGEAGACSDRVAVRSCPHPFTGATATASPEQCAEAVFLLHVTEQPSSRTFAGGDYGGRSLGARPSVQQAPSLPPGLPRVLQSSASSSQVLFSPTRPWLLGFLLVSTHTGMFLPALRWLSGCRLLWGVGIPWAAWAGASGDSPPQPAPGRAAPLLPCVSLKGLNLHFTDSRRGLGPRDKPPSQSPCPGGGL